MGKIPDLRWWEKLWQPHCAMPDNPSTELALIKLLSDQLADFRMLSARIEHLSEHIGRLEHNEQHRHQQIMETLTKSADDLTDGSAELTSAINDAITRIRTLSATDAQLLSIAGTIDHNTEVVKAQAAALRAALNPAPTPTPTP